MLPFSIDTTHQYAEPPLSGTAHSDLSTTAYLLSDQMMNALVSKRLMVIEEDNNSCR